MSQNSAPHSARHSGLPQTCRALNTPWNFRCATLSLLRSRKGLVGPVPKGRWRLAWTNRRYGRNLGSLIRTKLETPIKWMEASRFFSSKVSAPYTMCCEGDVHCNVCHWWVITAPRCTSKADGKCCLLLRVPAAPPSSCAQEKTTTPGGTESHHSSWQCQESHRCCCHGSLEPLAMGDSGTFTVLIRYESMRLRSLRQSKRTTARGPVQHKRWTYPCYKAANTEH